MKLALLAAAAAVAFFVSPAQAESVATRCGYYGCSHIVCNHTGDRCHRYFGDYYHPYYGRNYGAGYGYGDQYRRYDGYGSYDWDDYGAGYGGHYGSYYRGHEGRGWHYDCDRDADDCHVTRGGDDDYGWER